ncbi:hypothetical protein NDQ86_17885, partial [Salinispora arenicola]|nr:hypothetical protein [Salinispora arenicola]
MSPGAGDGVDILLDKYALVIKSPSRARTCWGGSCDGDARSELTAVGRHPNRVPANGLFPAVGVWLVVL